MSHDCLEVITAKKRYLRVNVNGELLANERMYCAWNAGEKKFDRYTVSDFGEGVGIGMQICPVDLNADGRIDLAVSGKTGTWVLLNQGK